MADKIASSQISNGKKKLHIQGTHILRNAAYPNMLRFRGLMWLTPFTALKACQQ